MTSFPEQYLVELMPVNPKDRTKCGQACPKCAFAKRGDARQELVVTEEQQGILMGLTEVMPERTFRRMDLHYNLFDPTNEPLAEKIALAQIPASVLIGFGQIDPSEASTRNLVFRAQTLAPFVLSSGQPQFFSHLGFDFCFKDLGSDLHWGQEHLDFARGVLQDVQVNLLLMENLRALLPSPDDSRLVYKPMDFRLSESWNLLPAGVQHFGTQAFMEALFVNRMAVAFGLATNWFDVTEDDFCKALDAGTISGPPARASCDSNRQWDEDYFMVDLSFTRGASWSSFGSRVMNLEKNKGLQPQNVTFDASECNFAILGDQVWVYHNQSYAKDGSLRFTFPEFRAILKQVQNQEGTLRGLVDGEIRRRRGMSPQTP
jgi:hypothetical protein